MARGVDEIQGIGLSVPGGIGQANRLAFYRDAPFPFNIHRVQNLVLKIPFGNDVGGFNQTVRQSGFAVINMGDNAEVSDMLHSTCILSYLL